jgi:hypothetical protein
MHTNGRESDPDPFASIGVHSRFEEISQEKQITRPPQGIKLPMHTNECESDPDPFASIGVHSRFKEISREKQDCTESTR